MSNPVDAPPDEEEITLKIWEDNESCLEDLARLSAPIERAIKKRFPSLKNRSEDIVAEAISRLWKGRKNYDSTRKLRPYLYRIAEKVACELLEGRYSWQKARNLEVTKDPMVLQKVSSAGSLSRLIKESESENSTLTKDFGEAVKKLPDIRRDVVTAYALAGDYVLNAASLGRELGKKHANGVPIPAGTIRQHKKRGMEFVIRELRKQDHQLDELEGTK